MTEEKRLQPTIIVLTGSMSKEDIKLLRDNGFCVVESKDPSRVRFMDPPPLDYSLQEEAAIELARTLLADGKIGTCNHVNTIGRLYADILLKGDPLKRVPRPSKVGK
jgi:hypothetical protein